MSSIEERHAELSCTPCKRLKRRCSKDLPTCSLCSKVGRKCVYPTRSTTPTQSEPPSELGTGGSRTRNGTPTPFSFRSTAPSNPFVQNPPSKLAFCFLDSIASRGSDAALPCDLQWRDVCPNSGEIVNDQAMEIVRLYFGTTHLWLPIVSKMRIMRLVREPGVFASADMQLLIHAMELDHGIDQDQDHTRDFARYQVVKTTLFTIEQSARFSTNFLAAYLLLALYEIGHGIFPAAYLTLGAIARLFCALGLHDRKKATQILPRPATWTETEERRRLWWAVLILDRYVHISFRFRPLCTPKIPPEEILPGRDSAWDIGELTVNSLLVMSIEASTSVDPFARTCQAAHLLGWVCEHVNQHPSSADADMHFQEAFSIAGALRALLTMLEVESNQKTREERQRLFAARGLAYAALNTLYDVHSCIEPDNVETVGGHRGLRLDLQQFAIDEFKKVILDVSAFASEVEDYCETYDVHAIPVMVLFCLYTVAGTYAWYAKENAAEENLLALADLRRVLKKIGNKRWKVASLYLELLHDQEYSQEGTSYQ